MSRKPKNESPWLADPKIQLPGPLAGKYTFVTDGLTSRVREKGGPGAFPGAPAGIPEDEDVHPWLMRLPVALENDQTLVTDGVVGWPKDKSGPEWRAPEAEGEVEFAPTPTPTPPTPTPTPITPTPTPVTPTPSVTPPSSTTPSTPPPSPSPTAPPATTPEEGALIESLEETSDERVKYEGIYTDEKRRGYGHSNHGRSALPLVLHWKPSTVLDVGCGHNEFAKSLRATNVQATGVDFACPSADILADAVSLPFNRKSFDVLTAFDMLEHLRPEQVDAVLAEFSRVSDRFVFSISYVDSVNRWKGHTLHPTVRPEEWWIERIIAAGGQPKKWGKYIYGTWGTRPLDTSKSLILVGNGPSILLRGERGSWIDTFDEVARFNSYAIQGFEPFTGTKTTLWSTFGRGMTPKDQSERPQRVIYTHSIKPKVLPFPIEEWWCVPRPFHDALRAKVQATSAWPTEDKTRLLPTSGLVVALWMLEEVKFPQLTIVGFDHFSKTESGGHHYYLKRSFKKPKEHDGEAEAAILAPYIAAGRITQL